MKKLILILCVFAASSVFANDQLKAIMKKMGADFKALGTQISDPSKNASSLQLVEDLSAQLKLAESQVPDTVSGTVPADPAPSLEDYQSEIKRVESEVDQLAQALQSNDNATAASILNQISQDKKLDHGKFDPKD